MAHTKRWATLLTAAALFATACAGQTPTGATSGGTPVRPALTPTVTVGPAPTTAPAMAATAPAPPPTMAPAPGTPATPPVAGTPAAPAPTGPAGTTPPPAPTGGAATTPAPAPTGGAATPPPPPTTVGNPTAGRAKFTGDAGCSACHGDKAQGAVFPGAAKLSGTALTEDQVRGQVRKPKDPSKGMPPFTDAQVTDRDISNIYAWFKTNP
ncbi:MAG: cytochrome c [Chloroflexi bacterium]|nr:cytochrome c [Chloroflexota bacterium]